MNKKVLAILALLLAAAGAVAYFSPGHFDETKPWWKGKKLIVIAPVSDPSNSFKGYAESDGTNITRATIYGEIPLTETECGSDSDGRFCLVTATDISPEGVTKSERLIIKPHPTGKIDSD